MDDERSTGTIQKRLFKEEHNFTLIAYLLLWLESRQPQPGKHLSEAWESYIQSQALEKIQV